MHAAGLELTIAPRGRSTAPVYGAARRLAVVLLLGLLLSSCVAPVRVEWDTETEMNTVGFNLYRGESPDGPFDVKVNDQLIPASPDPLTGGRYRYTDSTARIGVTYYYQLQEVERDGRINTYGPIAVRAGALDPRLGAATGVLAAGLAAWWMWRRRRAASAR